MLNASLSLLGIIAGLRYCRYSLFYQEFGGTVNTLKVNTTAIYGKDKILNGIKLYTSSRMRVKKIKGVFRLKIYINKNLLFHISAYINQSPNYFAGCLLQSDTGKKCFYPRIK